ncbi:hypothetical protein OW763_02685 [Clostridium aestuarii]|uniref:Uncharacterized protein n=2 Tax=Clostridium aestuarii TaxID=338193 RepID=A0ABT4CW78_9CLOT|nr:hypothetical protein [Clostridium aestuarii]
MFKNINDEIGKNISSCLTNDTLEALKKILTMDNKYKLYKNYIEKVYLKTDSLEEALANAYSYKKFYGKNISSSIRNSIKNFIKSQPRGYNEFDKYLSREKNEAGLRGLSTSILDTKYMYNNGIIPLEILFDIASKYVKYTDVPVYILKDFYSFKSTMKMVTSISYDEIIESNKFKKDLKSMPHNIKKRYKRALKKLNENINIHGLNFKKLERYDDIFTFRVNDNYRVSLREPSKNKEHKWELLRIAKHKDLYMRPF